jgi:Fe-S-cluster containining protein
MSVLNCAGCGVCCTSPLPPALLKLLGRPVEGVEDTQAQYFNDVLLFPEEIKALVEKGYADALQLYGFDENLVMFRLFSPLTVLDFSIFDPKDFPLKAEKGERWVGLSCIFQNTRTGTCMIHENPVRPIYCDIYPVRIESCPPHRITGEYSPEKLKAIEEWEQRKNAGEYLIHVDIKNFNPASLTTKTMTKLLSRITGINPNKINRLRANAYKRDPVAQYITKRFLEERELMNKIKSGAQMKYWIKKYE